MNFESEGARYEWLRELEKAEACLKNADYFFERYSKLIKTILEDPVSEKKFADGVHSVFKQQNSLANVYNTLIDHDNLWFIFEPQNEDQRKLQEKNVAAYSKHQYETTKSRLGCSEIKDKKILKQMESVICPLERPRLDEHYIFEGQFYARYLNEGIPKLSYILNRLRDSFYYYYPNLVPGFEKIEKISLEKKN